MPPFSVIPGPDVRCQNVVIRVVPGRRVVGRARQGDNARRIRPGQWVNDDAVKTVLYCICDSGSSHVTKDESLQWRHVLQLGGVEMIARNR